MWRVLLGFFVVLGLGYGLLSWTVDFNGDTLGRSLAGETGAPSYMFGCSSHRSVRRWDCTLLDGKDGAAKYRVRRTEGRCWEARRGSSDRSPVFPARAEGCVDASEAIQGALGFGPSVYD